MARGLPSGGSTVLGELIDEHGSALAHDLQAHYGISLRELVADLCSATPTTTPWWALVLVGELPDTSAYAASSLGGRDFRGWGYERHILAALFDAVQIQTVVVARAFGAKGAKPPKPLARPGEKKGSASGGVPAQELMRIHAKGAKNAQANKQRG